MLVLADDLIAFAWSAPMRDLAARLNLSDVGLKSSSHHMALCHHRRYTGTESMPEDWFRNAPDLPSVVPVAPDACGLTRGLLRWFRLLNPCPQRGRLQLDRCLKVSRNCESLNAFLK